MTEVAAELPGVDLDDDFPTCPYMMYAGSYYDQPEYCDRDLGPGEQHCPEHAEKVAQVEAWEAQMSVIEANGG